MAEYKAKVPFFDNLVLRRPGDTFDWSGKDLPDHVATPIGRVVEKVKGKLAKGEKDEPKANESGDITDA